MKHSFEWVKGTLETYQKKIDDLQEYQRQVCLEFIEQEAQKILTKYPELTVYCQAMGSWSFHDMWECVVDEVDGVNLEKDTTIAQIFDTYRELHLAGVPLKITKNLQTGEFSKETDW
jgi:hypothetical protein